MRNSPLLAEFADKMSILRMQYLSPSENLTLIDENGMMIKPMTSVAGNQLTVKIEILDGDVGFEIASIDAAEDYLISKLTPSIVTLNKNNVQSQSSALYITIMRSCNLIAQRTRRGAGNVVLVGQDVLDVMKQPGYVNNFEEELGHRLGRWIKAGTLNKTIDVYVGPMNQGEYVVFYNLNAQLPVDQIAKVVDGPGGTVYLGGKTYLHLIENDENGLSNYEDYIIKSKIEFVDGPKLDDNTWID